MFGDALRYPVRKGGWAMILTGTVLAVLLDVFKLTPVFGLAVAIFAAGYFSSFYLDIISSTMAGDDHLPDWPSFTEFLDDVVMPFLRVAGLVIASFWPVFVVPFVVDEEAPKFWWAIGVALVWGCFYFPMAALGSMMMGNLFGALPHIVLPAIVRSMPGYLLAVIGLAVAVAACGVAEEFGGRIPYVGWFVAAAVALYSLMMQARLIGLIHREKRDALGWE